MNIIYYDNKMLLLKKANKTFLIIAFIGVVWAFFGGNIYLVVFSIVAFLLTFIVRLFTMIDRKNHKISMGYKIFSFNYEIKKICITREVSFDILKYAATEGDMGYGIFLKEDSSREIWTVDTHEEGISVSNKIEVFLRD